MYLKSFWIENQPRHEIFKIDFTRDSGRIPRWFVMPTVDAPKDLLILRLISICLGSGPGFLHSIGPEIVNRWTQDRNPVFWGIDFLNDKFKKYRVQYKTYPDGHTIPILMPRPSPNDLAIFPGFSDHKKPFGAFAYGCNPSNPNFASLEPDPDFTPRPRSTRFASLFASHFVLTPVDAWIYRQYRNAAQYQSKTAEWLYNTSLSLMAAALPEISFTHWGPDQKMYFVKDATILSLAKLPAAIQRPIQFFVDIARNLADSVPKIDNFHLTPGILLLHQPESLFPGQNPVALKILADFFPNLQFIITSASQACQEYFQKFNAVKVPVKNPINPVSDWITTNSIRKKVIGQYRNSFRQTRFPKHQPAAEDTVVLVDVDSQIPNLALMKISTFYKKQGQRVILTRDSTEHARSKRVLASSIFQKKGSQEKIDKLRHRHGEHLQIGGSGVDLYKRLPPEIDTLMPDYVLYPGMDYALGFLTRGCPGNCKFCIVPQKEGSVKSVAMLNDLVPDDLKKVVLLDDNLLSYDGAVDLLKQIVQRNLQVNFNQALDLKYLTPENAAWLVKVDSRNFSFTKRMYYFGLNAATQLPLLARALKLLKGIQMRQMIFLCMYGYNTTLADDLQRFCFLDQHGLSPFVMEFQPLGDVLPPPVPHYFDTGLDPLLKIRFHYNGRNFENFLKWVSKKYILEFGKLYLPLVDLIFKYNNRAFKHRYIETLGGTVKMK